MILYIPTLGRVNKQVTLNNLPEILHQFVVLVTTEEEHGALCATHPGIKIAICPVKGIGGTRQWICDQHDTDKFGPHITMLDDDLRFFSRRQDDNTKFEQATDESIIAMFNAIGYSLLEHPLVGVCAREGGNRITVPFVTNTRILRLLAYDVAILRKEDVKFDRLIVMEDFDVALQLLEKGYPNLVIANWCHDQGGSNTAGGCSLYRTMEKQAEGAHGLKALHPKFVSVVEKETKTAWNGQKRTDVIVHWKKAFNANR